MLQLLLRETLQFREVHVKENRADCVVSVCDGNGAVTATRQIVAKNVLLSTHRVPESS